MRERDLSLVSEKEKENKPLSLEKESMRERDLSLVSEKEKENKPPISPLQGDCADVLNFLNQQIGARFEFIPTNLNLISARLKEGRTVEQLKNMIQFKVSERKITIMKT